MKLRSVCRTFRAIAYEMPFWQREPFDLVELLPASKSEIVYIYNDSSRFDRLQEVVACLEALLADKHLVQALARRSKWYFTNLVSFLCVKQLVPSLAQNTTRIEFNFFSRRSPATLFSKFELIDPSELLRVPLLQGATEEYQDSQPALQPIQFILSNLAHCERLTALDFSGRVDEIFNLDLVAKCCPLLRILRIQGTYQYRGALRNLSRLENLYINGPSSPPSIATLLPYASAKSHSTVDIGPSRPLAHGYIQRLFQHYCASHLFRQSRHLWPHCPLKPTTN